jgi:uncharacterized protein
LDYNWLTPKAQIRAVGEKGFGSFVIAQIKINEPVASFGGYVSKQSYITNLDDERISRSLQIDIDLFLVSGPKPESGDMLNHSCEPNCGAKGISTIVAARNIEIGEELTFDYAMTDASEYDEFTCKCRLENCRGKITGKDWENKEIQKKYIGWFSFYIEKLIKLSHSN